MVRRETPTHRAARACSHRPIQSPGEQFAFSRLNQMRVRVAHFAGLRFRKKVIHKLPQ